MSSLSIFAARDAYLAKQRHEASYGSTESTSGVVVHKRDTAFGEDLGTVGKVVDKVASKLGGQHHFVEIPKDKHGDHLVVGQGGETGVPLEGGHIDLPCSRTKIVDHSGQQQKAKASVPVEKYYKAKHPTRALDLDVPHFRKLMAPESRRGYFGMPTFSADKQTIEANTCIHTVDSAIERSNRNSPHYREDPPTDSGCSIM